MDERSQLIDPGSPGPGGADGGVPRRGALVRLLAVAVGAVLSLVPLLAGLSVALDPVRRRKRGENEAAPFIRVATVDSVPADGVPRAFRVLADREDAWTRHLGVPVGAVFLRRTAEKPDEVIAFNTTCPHLGCYVEANPDGSYTCPCHKSEFTADGSRGDPCVSPRGLDRLEAKIDGDEILVRFQNFHTGKTERVPIS